MSESVGVAGDVVEAVAEVVTESEPVAPANALVGHSDVAALVATFQRAEGEIRMAFALCVQAQKRLCAAFTPGDASTFRIEPEDVGGLFDVIAANPPFGQGRPELHHLRHMLGFLRPGGRIGVVMPNSLRFRDDALTVETRAMLDAMGVLYEQNAYDVFKEAGAMVRTVCVWARKGET